MKRFIAVLLTAWGIGLFSRLPNPGVDVGELEPVEIVLVDTSYTGITVRTDTGAKGWGKTLNGAVEDLQSHANGKVFLDTADYLILSGKRTGSERLDQVFRPGCLICKGNRNLKLNELGNFLENHPPKVRLIDLQERQEKLQTLEEERRGLRLVESE